MINLWLCPRCDVAFEHPSSLEEHDCVYCGSECENKGPQSGLSEDILDLIARAESLLEEMPYRAGGSLRVSAFQVQDVMQELIDYMDDYK